MEGLQGADLQPCQLSRSPAQSELARVALPGACLDMVRLGPGMSFTGTMPRGFYSLIFVLECPQPGRVFNFNIEHTDGYLGFFPPGSLLDATTPPGYRNASLTLPVADLESWISALNVELPDSLFTSGAGLRVDAEAGRAIAALASSLWGMIDDPSQALADESVRREVGRGFRVAYLDALISGSTHLVPRQRMRMIKRHEKLRRAREYLASHAHEPVYLDDLCAETGVSRRALESIFHDLLGLSPIAYLRHLRLHGVRRAIQHAPPEARLVKRFALEWGFWHLGHFAEDYYKLFGELPHQTVLK